MSKTWSALVGGFRNARDEMDRAWRYLHEPRRARWLLLAIFISMPVMFLVGLTLGDGAFYGLTVSWWIGLLATTLLVYRRSDRWELDRLPPPPNH